MELRYLSDYFYEKYKNCHEILIKENRPYIILIIELKNIKFAIPLRTTINVHKKYCYITNKSKHSGLDFEKAIPIFNEKWLSDKNFPTINQTEFNYIKFEEKKIGVGDGPAVAVGHHVARAELPHRLRLDGPPAELLEVLALDEQGSGQNK